MYFNICVSVFNIVMNILNICCEIWGKWEKHVHYVHDRDTKVRTFEVDHVVVKVYNKMHVEYKMQVE